MANKKHPKNSGGGSAALRLFFIILALLVIVILGLMIYANGISETALDPKDKTERSIHIEKGASTSSIGDILEEKKIIKSAFAFKVYTLLHRYDGQYQAGYYAMAPSMKTNEIAKILATGKTNNIQFTIPEGYTEYEIRDRLAEIGLVDKEEFTSLLEGGGFRTQYSFLKNAQKGDHYLEGYLFPSTYTVPANADGDYIITAMLNGYSTVFTDEYRARAKKLGYTENEIIIIASIIEKEAAIDSDRAAVASVIYNRLKDGMALQMDSTVQYVLSFDNNRKKDLTIDDTQVKSRYNTYKHAGLPPGPICCPGEKSIQAALYPEKTSYMYFILSDKLDGSMAFSKSYNTFLKDKEAYYAARDKAESKSSKDN